MVNVDIFSREDKHMVFDGFSVEGARAIFLKKKKWFMYAIFPSYL